MRSLLTATLLFAGCDGSGVDGAGEVFRLMHADALTPVAAADDPLVEHRPFQVDCPPAAWGPESGAFEIQTGVCNYAAFDQPVSIEIEVGDELRISIWHDRLDAAEPATAHAAAWLGRDVLWEDEVRIPGGSGVLEAYVPIERAPPEGSRLGIHLHNHGFNSWKLYALDIIRK